MYFPSTSNLPSLLALEKLGQAPDSWYNGKLGQFGTLLDTVQEEGTFLHISTVLHLAIFFSMTWLLQHQVPATWADIRLCSTWQSTAPRNKQFTLGRLFAQ